MSGVAPGTSVSVVIPVHNGVSTLAEAINSALREDPIEVVVVDDGSEDGSAEVAEALGDARVVVHRQARAGVSTARNAGALAARGVSLVFLDADDVLLPGALRALLAETETSAGGLHCSRSRARYQDGRVLPRPVTTFDGGIAQPLTPGAFVVERELFLSVGGYDERLGFAENTELGIRLIAACERQGLPIAVTTDITVECRLRHVGERGQQYAARVLAATQRIVDQHHALLDAAGATALYHSSAGVAAARLRDWRGARQFFWAALRSPGRRGSDGIRTALTLVPGLRNAIWKPSAP